MTLAAPGKSQKTMQKNLQDIADDIKKNNKCLVSTECQKLGFGGMSRRLDFFSIFSFNFPFMFL
jgi:uncharacterized protein YegL